MRRFLTMRRFLWILPSAWLATLLFAAAWVEAHPESKRPLYEVGHTKGVVGLAANFVHHIKAQMSVN